MFQTYALFQDHIGTSAAFPAAEAPQARTGCTTKDKECENLSDYFHNSSNPQDNGQENWQQMPVWQQSDMMSAPGMTMQQGGVPLYDAEGDFLSEGDNAPTRVDRPVNLQAFSRAAQQAEEARAEAEPAAEQPAAPRRRRSRVAERNAAEAASAAAPAPAPAASEFDPFSAGDSEVESPAARPAAAPAVRYAGPRTTVLPQRDEGGAPRAQQATSQPARRPAARPAQPGQRPPQRPAANGQSAAQRPAQRPPQRPVYSEEELEERPRRQAAPMEGPRKNAPRADEAFRRPSASVPRPRYEFEDEEDELEEEERRGGVLLPIVIALLVIGGLLAGLCVPDWQSIGGPVGGVLAPIREKVVGAFENVKAMILPEEEAIQAFSVTTNDTETPAQVLFTVQTAKNVTGLRIENDLGDTVYSGAYSADGSQSDVIANSNMLVWTPSCTIDSAYSGGFTAYATRKNGAEIETGVHSEETVAISTPRPLQPAMQSFTCDTTVSDVPVRITFTLTTSTEVSAVRVVDDSNVPLATMYDTDENVTGEAVMSENGDVRVWTLAADVEGNYSGSYSAQYLLADEGFSFATSGYSVQVVMGLEPTATPVPAAETIAPMATAAPTVAPTLTPEPTFTPEPTATPEPTPEPTATPEPTNAPLPDLSAEAADSAKPSAIGLKATVYSGGKTTTNFNREHAISMLNAFTTLNGGSDYAGWRQAGVLTFRSGPLRQNAAYGNADVQTGKLSLLWSQPVGGMKLSEGSVYGVTAPGQPVIVKWPTELRQRMGIKDEMKEVKALREVIVAAQDGKVYFYNLLTGEATRDPIDLGAPSRGGLSVATNATPILGVGQYNAKLAKKTVKNGYHILNLVTNEKERLIAGDGKDKNSNYTGVTGSALFDSVTGTMVVGAQNGVLYTAEFGSVKEAYNYSSNEIKLSTAYQGYKTQASDQKKTNTVIEGSVAMYNNYVYYGDQAGILQCVNVNTLQPVWALDLDETLESTPALDVTDSDVSLYTGNALTSKGTCAIYRINALTGQIVWTYEVPELAYVKNADVGCVASPVIGQESLSDVVIFTVTNASKSSQVLALNKKDGTLAWSVNLESPSLSSPVAVYNTDGDAWIMQAEQNGQIHLMDGKDGSILDTLTLAAETAGAELQIKASPAVYGNLFIIGTTGKDASGVYCIEIN